MLNEDLMVRAMMQAARQMAGTRAWRMHRGAAALMACLLCALASLAPVAASAADPLYESQKLVPSDGMDNGSFGTSSVAISGDVIVVGAPWAFVDNITAGAAYVFRRVGSTWVEEQKLFAYNVFSGDKTGLSGDKFGYSVSVSGNKILVGAPGEVIGHMYPFEWSGVTWELTGGLTMANAVAGDEVGSSVAISGSGEWAVAGAPNATVGTTDHVGKAAVFEAIPPVWGSGFSHHQNVSPIDFPEAAERFGHSVSVSLSGSITPGVILVGRPYHDGGVGANQGYVEAFEYNAVAVLHWSSYQIIAGPVAAAQALFGWSVSVAGDLAIVGAPGQNAGQGAAFLFKRNAFPCSSCWSNAGILMGQTPSSSFGSSVSLSGNGDVAVAGAPGALIRGRAYVYRPNGSTWEQTRELIGSDAGIGKKFGSPAAVSGETVVVGSGTSNGGVYVFDLSDTDADSVLDAIDNCTLVANPDQCDSDGDGFGNRCDGDMNNNTATNAQDYVLFRQQLGTVLGDPYNEADINCNGVVNAQDYVLFRQLLGSPPGPAGLVP